jgi:molybdopterin molybdotransferase
MKNDSIEQISISINEAQLYLQQLVPSLYEIESHAPLHLALGRVLANDIISPISVPPHDNSAMDGFAFHSSAFSGCNDGDGILELAIVGKALAGKAWSGVVGSNECVQITTGAVMPTGVDTVVPSELVTLAGTSIRPSIRFPHKAIFAGDNRRKAGEDLMQGSIALVKGSRFTPAALGLVASLGIATVPVFRLLRVAYFSTGDEILSHLRLQPLHDAWDARKTWGGNCRFRRRFRR